MTFSTMFSLHILKIMLQVMLFNSFRGMITLLICWMTVDIAGLLYCFQISIEPPEAGTFTTQLQVYSFPVVCEAQPVAHSLGPVLALEIVAEESRVEVCQEN